MDLIKLTVFSMLEALYVTDCVNVVTWLGTGRKVVATVYGLAGYSGAVSFAVMVDPGFGCIGANFVKPV